MPKKVKPWLSFSRSYRWLGLMPLYVCLSVLPVATQRFVDGGVLEKQLLKKKD